MYLFSRAAGEWVQTRYIKAPVAVEQNDRFGDRVVLSADAGTLVVSSLDDSESRGLNGNQTNHSAEDSGALFVFSPYLACRESLGPPCRHGYHV